MAQAHKKRGGNRKAKAKKGNTTSTNDTNRWSTTRDEGAYRRLANGKVVTLTKARNIAKS